MVDSATILTSASVAGFVTLAIEYAAKPGLEARKDRVVAEQRLQREVTDLLQLAHSNIGMIQDFRNANERADTALDAVTVFLEDLPRLRRRSMTKPSSWSRRAASSSTPRVLSSTRC